MSHIEEFSPYHFNEDQRIAGGLLKDFLDDEICRVFILKGHAGTGKTTVIDALIKYAKYLDLPVVLLASTGRAAKIVGQKASFYAETVHKHIYKLDVEKADDENKIRRLIFELRRNHNPENTIFIVDECSMVSDHATSGVFIDFGSGKLLTDLFLYLGSRKVIFSGDPCQLPPINAAFSPALDAFYLKTKFGKTVSVANLTQIMRHHSSSGIYLAATSSRQSIEQKEFGYLNIYVRGYNDLHRIPNIPEIVWQYVDQIKHSGIDANIIICYTNAMAAELNREIRSLLFPGKPFMVKGELLIVVQNNYKINIANGEHIQITELGNTAEQRAGMSFRTIEGYAKDHNGIRIIKGLVIEDLLYAKEPGLTSGQEYELFKDFAIRTKKKGIKPKDSAYLNEMLSDPYLNAIRAKFGYAITCHKAQGGEWNHVYIVLERCLFNPTAKENQFRWAYTAISRGIQHVYFLDNYCLK